MKDGKNRGGQGVTSYLPLTALVPSAVYESVFDISVCTCVCCLL